ncbi:hypothetical protein NQ315_012156 [Exocentrus adspersus]|uniref:Uncharacterized protein n=1 Tax=Exocentrus adspersus TaxID=1586481 RepID=A0AAV8VYF7_9CUCU|nr:hypothetical protein NQ315_012156 [Exocentrus adspersus]
MNKITALVLTTVIAVVTATSDDLTSTTTTQQPPQPIYNPPKQPPTYVARQPYPYSGYGFEDFLYPPNVVPAQPQAYSEEQAYSTTLIPETRSAIQLTLKVLTKFGLFVLGGATLLLIGGIFTTALCHLTSVCVISFPALGGLDKSSMRSLMTPDKISAAAALVQDAIGKYQRLQRAAKL